MQITLIRTKAIRMLCALVFFSYTFSSCRKEAISNIQKTTTNFRLNEIQSQFEAKKYNKASLDLIQPMDNDESIVWDIEWKSQEIATQTISGVQYLYVPIIPRLEHGNEIASTYNFNRFLLISEINGELKFFLSQAIGINKSNMNLNTFTGTLGMKDLDANEYYRYRFENGNIKYDKHGNEKLLSTRVMGTGCITLNLCTWWARCPEIGGVTIMQTEEEGFCASPPEPLECWSLSSREKWTHSHTRVVTLNCPPSRTEPIEPIITEPIGITDRDIEEARPVDNGELKIADIKKYKDCFNDGKPAQSYTLTIYADQPIKGKNDSYRIIMPKGGVATDPYGVPTGIVFESVSGKNFDVGHSFVCFEKNNTDGTNVRQTLGFYPDPAGSHVNSKGVIKDNSNHAYDVSYKITVSVDQFNKALQQAENDFNNAQYILSNSQGTRKEYNCTDAAVNWMNKAGANIAGTLSGNGLFDTTPGGLGEALRNKPGANKDGGLGPKGKGPCN